MKKKVILILISLFVFLGLGNINAASKKGVDNSVNKTEVVNKTPKKKWFERDSRIEIVNENTIIFKDVIKIEIRTNDKNQITYVYDLVHSKLVKVARGTFDVELSRGDYLIQSDKRITKTIYEVIIE